MSEIPIRLGSPEQFRRVRESFRQAGFHDERLSMPQTDLEADEMFRPYSEENRVPDGADDAEVFTGVFLRGAVVSKRAFQRAAGEQPMRDMIELGMLRHSGPDSGMVFATVRVRPLFGLHVISDLWARHAGSDPASDIVYPPDIANTAKYLSYIPNHPSRRFLEACGGSGVAALIAAQRFAQQAWSFDITERSTRFAEFSGKLNGLENFQASCGDLYDPAEGGRFDHIVAHPPYVPVLRPTWIYHGGGVDGEAITRRLVEGLPQHLEPGGRFLCRCVGSDRQDHKFEDRVRSWLGEHESEFDVAVAVLEAINPIYYITVSVLRGRSGLEDLPEWRKAFEEAGIVRFLSMFFVVQRRAEPRPVFTVRRDVGPLSGPRELEWMVQWETVRASGRVHDELLSKPLISNQPDLRSLHRQDAGRWELAEQHLSVSHPYHVSWPVEPWCVYLLSQVDGKRTGVELYQLLRDEEIIHPEIRPQEFASALAEMVSGGFLRIQGSDWPEPRS